MDADLASSCKYSLKCNVHSDNQKAIEVSDEIPGLSCLLISLVLKSVCNSSTQDL